MSSAPWDYSGMSTHEVSEDLFWEMVDEVGWPDVDIDSAKIKLMQRYDVQTMARFREIFARKSSELSDAAAVDWCCDGWDDTRAHIVGLGRLEYQRNLLNPSLIRDRYHNYQFRESFAYCLPFSDDYDLLSDSAYAKRCAYIMQLTEKATRATGHSKTGAGTSSPISFMIWRGIA